jgi:hypothetical protein
MVAKKLVVFYFNKNQKATNVTIFVFPESYMKNSAVWDNPNIRATSRKQSPRDISDWSENGIMARF